MTTANEITFPASLKPSPAVLAKATGGAVLAACAILTLFVLPAEYNIDLTGAGAALGLKGMVSGGQANAGDAPVVSAAGPVTPTRQTIERATAWREDEMTITLPPHSGQEVKAHMAKGDSLIFRWTATGGPVKAEMHGEVEHAAEGQFTDYWKEMAATGGQGDFTAPFEGRHGWYFRNKGEVPVKLTVKTVGFYRDLFQPHNP
jgi:hypothetical protein